jgi:hypothetical protein
MVLDSYAEVYALLTRRPRNANVSSMIRRAFFITALGLLIAGEQEPWFGTWNLNLSKSSNRSDSPRYKRALCRVEPWEGGLKVTYDMVGIRGGITHTEWTGKFDSKDYPMQGVDNVLTNAYRRIDDHTYEIVIKVDGVRVATARVTVSPDSKTLNVSTEEKTSDGKMINTSAVYDRQ